MLEISPVLAETNRAALAAPGSVNFTVGGASASSATEVSDDQPVDPRRYSKFDRTASQVGSTSLSFGDVLDMLNPLQHIPVISSVYREITGDKINPVSRVVGDIMYGGAAGVVTGMATALAGGVGAVADSVMEAKTGKDVKGTMIAELFGDDKAAAENSAPQIALASNAQLSQTLPSTPFVSSASSASPAQSSQPAVTQLAAATAAAAYGNPVKQMAQNTASVANTSGTSATNKLPFGGVMTPVKSLQEQNMAMALASATSTNGIRLGNSIYTNRFMNGPRPAPAVVASASSALPNPKPATATPASSTGSDSTSSTANSTPVPTAAQTPTTQTPVPAVIANAATPAAPVTTASAVPPVDRTIPPSLADDALVLKALGMYQNVATGSRSAGNNTIN